MDMLDTTTEDIVMSTRIHMRRHTPMTRDIIMTTVMIMNMAMSTSTITTVATNRPYYQTLLPQSLTPMPATPILTTTKTCMASSSTS
jgi:hypothetical protein